MATKEQLAAWGAEFEADYQRKLEHETTCVRCRAHVDGRTAYHQKERYMGTMCASYYCAGCAAELKQIGIGEYTDMQARASERPSRENETKTDD